MEDSNFLAPQLPYFTNLEGTKRVMLFAKTCDFALSPQMNMQYNAQLEEGLKFLFWKECHLILQVTSLTR